MHPALAHFFDTHREGTAAHKRAMHDQLAPIMETAGAIRSHAITLEAKLQAAELEAHDHVLDGKMEYMHGKLRVLEQRAAAVQVAGRELAHALADVEHSFTQDALDVDAALATRMTGSRG
jgi:hypothetical protein